jgi:hypothetical protein
MAQRRPDRMSDDELFKDWLAGIERIYMEMIALGRNRHMFKMMRDVADRNERLHKTGGHVLEWMFGNYLLSAAMSFRRGLDRDTSPLGMLNLLYEIEERPTIINRARYRAMFNLHPRSDMDPQFCHKAFNVFKPQTYRGEPERDHINPAVLTADREKLLYETEKIRLLVEQTFAHRARGTPETVRWGEFHVALDVLVEVFESISSRSKKARRCQPRKNHSPVVLHGLPRSRRGDEVPRLLQQAAVAGHRLHDGRIRRER